MDKNVWFSKSCSYAVYRFKCLCSVLILIVSQSIGIVNQPKMSTANAYEFLSNFYLINCTIWQLINLISHIIIRLWILMTLWSKQKKTKWQISARNYLYLNLYYLYLYLFRTLLYYRQHYTGSAKYKFTVAMVLIPIDQSHLSEPSDQSEQSWLLENKVY